MNAAPPAAQAFAVRAALASQKIQDWLEELSSWPWPSQGGSVGFETPPSGSIQQQEDKQTATDVLHMGSLLASNVAEYEARIDDILRDKDELDVEEIKDQILHNHIRPLSRPGSPLLDSSCSVTSSLSAFARMDDLTALLTATTVQALPNLLKLERLLDIWSTRLLVLKRIPSFLKSIHEGEQALQSAWSAMQAQRKEVEKIGTVNDNSSHSPGTLSRQAFGVMNSILARKVAKAGQNLDLMLNMLETSEDTLPEHWIDRMDSLEREYSEWTVVCERMVREADLSNDPPGRSGVLAGVDESGGHRAGGSADERKLPAVSASLDHLIPSATMVPGHAGHDTKASAAPAIKVHPSTEDDKSVPDFPRSPPLQSVRDSWAFEEEPIPSTLDGSFVDDTYPDHTSARENDSSGSSPSLLEALPIASERRGGGDQPDIFDSDFESEQHSETDSPSELPVLPRRRDSDVSTPSTIIHSSQAGYMEFSSDPHDSGTPELPGLRDSDARATITSADISPNLAFRYSLRSHSTSFNDMPTVTEVPDDESPPKTPSKICLYA